MLRGLCTHSGLGIAKTAGAIFLILEQVGIHRTRLNAVFLGEGHDLKGRHALCKVPEKARRNLGAAPRQLVDFSGVGQLVPQIKGRTFLPKFPESRPGVRKTPRWQLNPKMIKGTGDTLESIFVHQGKTCLPPPYFAGESSATPKKGNTTYLFLNHSLKKDEIFSSGISVDIEQTNFPRVQAARPLPPRSPKMSSVLPFSYRSTSRSLTNPHPASTL